MSKLSRRIRLFSISLAVLFGLVLLGLSLPMGGWRSFSVQTGSMEPAIPTGSLVLVDKVPPADLRPGDVITYISPLDKTQTITHRILATRTNEMGSLEFTTAGDANPLPDEAVSSSQIVGAVKWHVPVVGKITSFALNPVGLAALIYMPAIIVMMGELRRLITYYRSQQRYVVPGFTHHHGGGHTLLGAKVAAGLLVLSIGLAVPVHAALNTSVTLTGNSISSTSTPQTPPSNTCTISNSNNVSVTTNTSQTASSGSATNTNNTTSGNATSGSASNSSQTSTTITASNSSTCPQTP